MKTSFQKSAVGNITLFIGEEHIADIEQARRDLAALNEIDFDSPLQRQQAINLSLSLARSLREENQAHRKEDDVINSRAMR